MGDCQGGEAQLSPLDKPGVYTPGAVKNLILHRGIKSLQSTILLDSSQVA